MVRLLQIWQWYLNGEFLLWAASQRKQTRLSTALQTLWCSSFCSAPLFCFVVVFCGCLSLYLCPKSSAWNRTKRSGGVFFLRLFPFLTLTLLVFIPALGLWDHFIFLHPLITSMLLISVSSTVELKVWADTPGVPADVQSLALKRALASSPDAFATLCLCHIFAMWGDQDRVWCHAEAKWWVCRIDRLEGREAWVYFY